MKAIQFPAKGNVNFINQPDPTPAEGQIVIDVCASGICHTDYEVLNANYGASAFPVTPGHEYAGTISQIGPGVSGLKIGDRVVVDPNIECGSCSSCKRGWAHLCNNLQAYGVTMNGGFAEKSLIAASAAYPINEMDFSIAALAEPMGCVLNGVETFDIGNIQNSLIFGAGPMGLLMAVALKTRGVEDICVVDVDQSRLELTECLGFTPIPSQSRQLEMLHHSVDVVVDATGVPSVAADLTNYITNGGNGLYFGVCPSMARIEISPFEVFRRQLTLAGSHSLNHNIADAIKTIKAFGPDIKRLISHQLPLNEISAILANKPPKGSLKIQAVNA